MPAKRGQKKRSGKRAKPAQEKRIKDIVKNEMRKEIEHKWYDRVSTGNTDSVNLVAVQPLASIVRGTGVNNYIGSSIKITSMEIRLQLLAADAPGNVVRMIIIQDKTTSGTPLTGTLFNTIGGTCPAIVAPFNKDYSDTYTLLKDKTYLLTNDGATSSGFLPKNLKIFISGKKLRQVKFTASTGALDAGSIWVCFISDSSAAANPTFAMSLRTNYMDA